MGQRTEGDGAREDKEKEKEKQRSEVSRVFNKCFFTEGYQSIDRNMICGIDCKFTVMDTRSSGESEVDITTPPLEVVGFEQFTMDPGRLRVDKTTVTPDDSDSSGTV